MFKDLNQELIKLQKKSGLNKSQFATAIGTCRQNLNRVLKSKHRLGINTYDKYVENYNNFKKQMR